MQNFMGPAVVIDAEDGTSTHNAIINAGLANGFSVHLVTTGTLNTGTGWVIQGSNGPKLDNSSASGPDTTTFDWVTLSDITITAPDGTAISQFLNVSDWRGKWLRVRWDSTSMTSTGNVSAAVYLKGTG